MSVGVLQAFAGERGASGRRADEESVGQLIGHGPDRVAGALEAEHRIEEIDGDHRFAVCRVGTAGCCGRGD